MKRVLESTYSPTERRVLFSIRPSTGRNLSRYLEWLENGRHRMERHCELSGAKFMDSANYLDRSATIPLFAPPSLSFSPFHIPLRFVQSWATHTTSGSRQPFRCSVA